MVKRTEMNGLSFRIYEGGASAKLSFSHTSEEVIVPPEVDGVPVKCFILREKDGAHQIKYVMLPASVEEFVYDIDHRHSIRIEVDENNPRFFSDGKALYTKDHGELIHFFARDDEEYTIVTGCVKIADNAFNFSKKLKRVTFPEGLNLIGESAFNGCTELMEPDFSDGLVRIEASAFNQCPKLERIALPLTLEYIGDKAFSKGSKELVVRLPKALAHIGIESLPDNWTLELSEENPKFISRGGLILSRDGRKVITMAKPPENGVLIIPEYVTEICPYAFFNNYKIEKVIFPKVFKKIGQNAFNKTKKLKEVVIGDIGEIEDFAFECHPSLEKISLKCGKIGRRVFADCKNLTEAEIDCERTGISMFEDCKKLQKAVLKHTKVISVSTFTNASALTEISFSPELEEIGDRALSNVGLEPLTIPKTVKKLGKCFANHADNIHIYDNIETDISAGRLPSYGHYTLYVHSAETDEIKFAVPFVYTENETLAKMFKGGASFDFKKYDVFFCKQYSHFVRNHSHYKHDTLLYWCELRLEYGYELDDKMRREYENIMGELAVFYIQRCIWGRYLDYKEQLFNPAFYKFISAEDMIPLIDLSAKKGMTELTAFLMQICNQKRTNP